jgi:predicted Zn-dependent protease
VIFLRAFCAVVLLSAPLLCLAQAAPDDPVLATMSLELDRLARDLRKAPVPIYFLSYQLTDNQAVHVGASFGALNTSQEQSSRALDIDLRVGDYALDNTHVVRGGASFDGFAGGTDGQQIPLDGDPDALRAALWQETERKYQEAVQRFEKVKTNIEVKVAQEDRSGDFSKGIVETHFERPAPFVFDKSAWEQKVRTLTAPFARHRQIIEATALLSAELETRRYVNTDGSRIQTSSPFYRLIISATAKADDGMELPIHRTYMSFSPEGLPDDATLGRDVDRMVQTLLALAAAPVAEPYTGPAILSGRAAAVFFHEIFGHRIEGQRQKNEEEAQTFKKKLNRSVLPSFLSVYSDPSLRRLDGVDLVGSYPFDDEGVKAHRVTIVKNGVLKGFLMSRAPIEGFDRSNGHGRRQQGYKVVARQSNLIVQPSRTVSRAELKRMLIKQVKAAGKSYGLLFDDIEGGFTFTMRILPNAFNVRPTVVHRVYPDGKEELVRGVDLIGTPLIAFSKIVAADGEPAVFNGICGAESGWVPVSAVSPGLLVSQIEVQRKERSQERAPLLLPPPAAPEK